MAGTDITVLRGAQFAQRVAELFPRGWASDDAVQPGGNVYALLLAVGNELSFVQSQLEYALRAQRLDTETFPELDFASIDYFGEALPRPSGASDATFAALIVGQLFQPAATRTALQNALTALTGFVPRMLEPWSVNDTGSWGNVSYWNVDTVRNPARWGNGGLRYQGFIETAPPNIPAIGPNNPILCWGDSAYWNVPGYLFGIIPPVNLNAIDDLINRLRAYGTIVWFKIVSQASLVSVEAPSSVGNLAAVPAGTNSVLVSWTSPTSGTPPFSFTVLYRQAGAPGNFITGPTVSVTSATIGPQLAAGTTYEVQVTARNNAGAAPSGTVSATTVSVPPSPAQNLHAVQVQARSISVTWDEPTSGTPPFSYVVQYRIVSTTIWQSLAVSPGTIGISILNLVPNTSYEIEVITSNA